MAVTADYINMAISLVLSNRQGTDVEYRLPNDIRKCFDDFALPNGYNVVRGTMADGATVNMNATDTENIFFALFLSDACTVTIKDVNTDITLNLATLILSANKDADILLKDAVDPVAVTNSTGAAVEYTYVVGNT
jgi:hypothetical protein